MGRSLLYCHPKNRGPEYRNVACTMLLFLCAGARFLQHRVRARDELIGQIDFGIISHMIL